MFLTIAPVPTGYPRIVSVTSISPSILNVTWTEVECSKQNGQILEYHLVFAIGTRLGATKRSNPQTRYIILRGLMQGKVYNYRVAAVNRAGVGRYSRWRQFIAP